MLFSEGGFGPNDAANELDLQPFIDAIRIFRCHFQIWPGLFVFKSCFAAPSRESKVFQHGVRQLHIAVSHLHICTKVAKSLEPIVAETLKVPVGVCHRVEATFAHYVGGTLCGHHLFCHDWKRGYTICFHLPGIQGWFQSGLEGHVVVALVLDSITPTPVGEVDGLVEPIPTWCLLSVARSPFLHTHRFVSSVELWIAALRDGQAGLSIPCWLNTDVDHQEAIVDHCVE
mmetsp:Transcript_20503/g.44669  ORF Transcript_20503/g.44669 Transcript_20503/m.44669 type:complete len:229 (+) Transcript_20503:30-716(+)